HALRALALWSLIALTAGAASAQGTPSLALDSFTYTQGESLRLTGRGLVPGAVYTFPLPPPAGAGQVRQSQAPASSLGNLSRTEELDVSGVWTVELVGPEMNTLLRVTVNPDPNAPRPAAPASPPASQPQQQQNGQAAGEEPPAQAQDQQDAEDLAPGSDDEPDLGGELPQITEPGPALQEPPTGVPTASIRDDDVVGVSDAREVWRLSFGPDSGGTSGLLQLAD